jgi:hypothetical protein
MGPGSSLPSRAVMILSGFLRSLPLRDQLFGDLCLSLQPGQARLLVHTSRLLAGRQPFARGGDHLAVGPLTALAAGAG